MTSTPTTPLPAGRDELLWALDIAAAAINGLDEGNPRSETGWVNDELLNAWLIIKGEIARLTVPTPPDEANRCVDTSMWPPAERNAYANGYADGRATPPVSGTEGDDMTIIERLLNPQWVHGPSLNSDAVLDKEQTLADMKEGAAVIVSLQAQLAEARADHEKYRVVVVAEFHDYEKAVVAEFHDYEKALTTANATIGRLTLVLDRIRDMEPGTQEWIDGVIPEQEKDRILGEVFLIARAALAPTAGEKS